MNTDNQPVAPLVDPFERHIRYLRISVTDRCSLRCFYCMPDGLEEKDAREEVLSLEEIARLARIFAAVGVEKIRLTGGEPLFRKGMVDLVRELHRHAGIHELAMTTNALALAPNARRLKDNGLTRVNISLDSLRPERFLTITKYDGLAKVLQGLDAAIEVGLEPVKVNVVVMKGVNSDEILDFADLAYKRPIHVRFIEYMPFGPGIPGQARHFVPSSQVVGEVLKRYDLEPEDPDQADGPATTYRIPGGQGSVGVISPIDTGFCEGCNRVRLTATGFLRLCLFGDEGIDLRGPLREGESDEQIVARLHAAMKVKPEKHHLEEGIPYEGMAMSQVGG